MLRLGTWMFVLSSAACVTAAVPAPDSWKDCHCGWLDSMTSALAGEGMVDCGFVNLLEDPSRGGLHAGMSCARKAFTDGKPFRYGSLRIPVDSYAHEVLIRSADGSLWLLTVDRMIDQDEAQFWKRKCQRLRFKMHDAGYIVEGCDTAEAVKP